MENKEKANHFLMYVARKCRPGRFSFVFGLVVVLLCVLSVEGRKEPFNKRTLEEGESLSNKIVFLTAKDSIIGSTTPTFTVNQTITLKNPDSNANLTADSTVTVLFFGSSESERIGYIDSEGMLQLCCTEELVEDNKCSDPGSVLIYPSENEEETSEDLISREFHFYDAAEEFKWDESWEITSSGVYELLYINCKGSDLGDVVIDGSITYVNPFGHLSAESYPLLWFFGFMTFALIIIGTVWGVFMLIHRSVLISLQHFLSVLLVLEFVEAFTWFIMLWVSNRTGTIHWGWITLTVLTSSIKRTSVGLLYLLISLGYGIMNKAKISDNRRLIALVIGFYFAVSTGQELVTAYIREGIVSSDTEVLLGFVSLILLFPSVVIPLGLFWWICACLSKTLQKVKLRNQQKKLELYTKIMISLIVACVVTLLMLLMQTGISIVDSDEIWRVWWLFTSYWFILFFGLTISLLLLFHPSKNEEWLSYTKRENLTSDEDFSTGVEIELDDLEKDMDINFDFDLGFDDNMEEETSKID